MPPPVVNIVDRSFPLPEHVAREVNLFHRLMRSYFGLVVALVIILCITVQPLLAVAPTILLMTWLGVFRTDSIQRFYDYSSGQYISMLVVSAAALLAHPSRSLTFFYFPFIAPFLSVWTTRLTKVDTGYVLVPCVTM